MNYKYIELFSGPGGLATGFKKAGFLPLISIEVSETTVATYSMNHDTQVVKLDCLLNNVGKLETILDMNKQSILIHGDVRKVSNDIIKEILIKKYNVTTVDMVVGCPPCESFSMAGKRSEKDDRNDLFKEIIRVSHLVDCKVIFFENVKGLLTKKRNGTKGGQFEYIIKCFEERNLKSGKSFKLVSTKKSDILLTASNYGVPQKRDRIFLVAFDEKYDVTKFTYPEKTHGTDAVNFITVEEAFYDLPKIHSGEGDEITLIKYSFLQNDSINEPHRDFMNRITESNNEIRVSNHKSPKHRDYMIKRFSHIKQGEGMKSACERLRMIGRDDIIENFFPKKIYAARGRRLKPNEPSFTVTSHSFDEMLHPYYNRALSPREVARLQTFPDNYIFAGPYTASHCSPIQDKYEQIGDAVPVFLAEKIGIQLKIAIESLKADS